MAADVLWRAYVEIATPSLQDTDGLLEVVRVMRARPEVVAVAPTVASRGEHTSLAATIVLHARDADAAAARAGALFQDACRDAGFALGGLTRAAAEPIGPA